MNKGKENLITRKVSKENPKLEDLFRALADFDAEKDKKKGVN